ncbi:general substrate transporter [Clohesyomyces aquaticus]|uniref:General substrate transporter n=1 Tax=Clohesyomyces aquaticus TaxID=1231657 RepID=A0A1Y1ZJS1_9PLEO|nr:general substrate transporter [Clohesyomyces aquaticus]
MAQEFHRLPSLDEDGEESRYYSRTSLDVVDGSYDQFRRRPDAVDAASTASLLDRKEQTRAQAQAEADAESKENSAPLRKALRLYRKLMGWMLLMSIVILYSGFDSAVVSMVQSVKKFQLDFGELQPIENKPDGYGEGEYWEISAKWLSLWDGVGPLGQLAGTFLGGYLIDRIGRRFSLVIGSIIGCIAIAILFFANRFPNKDKKCLMILIGKVVQGLGLGIMKIETFTYMSEVIPVSLKGAVMSFVPTFTLLGQLIGALVVQVTVDFPTPKSYLIPLASQYAVALPPLLFAFFLPESPAYLLKSKNDTTGALKSFKRLLGRKHDANLALQKMKKTLDEEAKNSSNASYAECFNSANRRRTAISFFAGSIEFCFGLSLLSGISYFLQKCGMAHSKSTMFTIIGILAGLVSNSCSTWTVSHIGRRTLIISTLSLTSVWWTVMGFSGIKQFPFTAWIAGGCATAVVVTCGLGCWPASYAVLGETSSIRLRSKSQAIGGLANNLLGIAMNAALPQLYNSDRLNLGAKTGFLFTGLTAGAALITYFCVPELKGRSAMEIDVLFKKGVPARGSKKWKYMYEEIPMGDA